MNILLLEPFFTGSHQRWAEGYQQYSQHEITIFSLKGRHWKWRMYGGAVSLAKQCNDSSLQPDLILATDMLDLTTFVALTKKQFRDIPIVLYFHENQITYPWSPDDQDTKLNRNNQYGFINYTSALAADMVFFNSAYHLESFIDGLSPFLKQFPDERNLGNTSVIRKKSMVLPLGIDLKKYLDFQHSSPNESPIILWNHRWEYDKNPEVFFNILFKLSLEKIDFNLVVLGTSYKNIPPIFNDAKSKLAQHLLHWGFADSLSEYTYWMWKADILPVTSNQDFFGVSVVEAMYCNCYPLLPFRLAYPEHIPRRLHQDYFYHSEEELYTKLKYLLNNTTELKQPNTYKNFVARYDWSNLAPHYDEVLKNTIRK